MARYLDFEITLRYATPPVWRRLQLQASATFLDLHHAIQDACGWQDSHLFRFEDIHNEPIAGVPDGAWDEPDPDAAKVRLDAHFPAEGSCIYLYDFGDSWEHEIALRQDLDLPETFRRRLVGGERAFPPEDCGGIPGYEQCAHVARGGQDPEGLKEWMGDWHPDRFDIDRTRSWFDR